MSDSLTAGSLEPFLPLGLCDIHLSSLRRNGLTAAKPAFCSQHKREAQMAVKDTAGQNLPGPCHQPSGSLLSKLLSASKHHR